MNMTMQQAPVATDQPQYVITDDDKKRLKAIQDAWKGYHGQLEKPLEPMPGEADDNVMVNVCLPIVEAGTDFLFGQELEISLGKTDPQAAKDFLDRVWGKKEARIPLLQKMHINGAIGRNAFLRIVPGRVKPGRDQDFRLVVLDPATVYLQTAPGDVDTIIRFCIQYACTEQVNGRPQQRYYREEISRIDPDGNALAGLPDEDDTWELRKWTQTANVSMEPKQSAWTPDGAPLVWPYPFPPIFFCQNMPLPNDAWGMPDITPGILSLNNSINLAKSATNRNLKLFGQPILAASGIGDSDISLTPGHVNITAPDGKLYAVPIPSDIPAAMLFLEELRGDVDQESHVPGVASGRMKELPRLQSGIAVELMYQTLTMKTAKKRCTYGELIIDVSNALLVLGGFQKDFTDPDIEILLQWQASLPKDDLQAVQAAALKISGIGVSKMTIQEEIGYDPDEEAARNAEADQQALLQFSRGQGMPPIPPGQPPMPGQQPPPAQPEPMQGAMK